MPTSSPRAASSPKGRLPCWQACRRSDARIWGCDGKRLSRGRRRRRALIVRSGWRPRRSLACAGVRRRPFKLRKRRLGTAAIHIAALDGPFADGRVVAKELRGGGEFVVVG